jgi:O-acetylhomoserine (thiol)-lyase
MTFQSATKCVYMPMENGDPHGAVNPPIYQSAGFAHPNPDDLEDLFNGRAFGHVYSRISNPTITELERRITYLESGVGAVAMASGLAAIYAVAMGLCVSGQTIIVSDSLFGGTRDLFEETIPKLGVHVQFCNMADPSLVAALINEHTAFVFCEIISNPKLVIADVPQLKKITAKAGVPLVVDATITGAVGFDAKNHGADVVIHSSTKLFATNGGAVGGIIVDTGNFNWQTSTNADLVTASKKFRSFAFIERLRRHAIINAGFNTSPMNAYFTMVGLETLALRYERISDNALTIAEWFVSEGISVAYPGLSTHPQHALASILFCGNGPLLTIDMGSKDAAFAFIKQLKVVQNMSNLGDNRTMVIHPKSTIYAKHTADQWAQGGITDGLVRLNIGIEAVDDLIAEFKEAIK